MTLIRTTAAAATLLALSGTASAQDIQNFKPAPGAANYFSVDGAQTSDQGTFVPSLYVNYGSNPLSLRDSNDKVVGVAIESLLTVDVLASYSITDFLEVGVAVPFSIVTGGAELDTIGGSDGTSLNDVRMSVKGRILNEEGLSLALVGTVTAPTGDAKMFTSDDTWVIEPSLNAESKFGPVRVGLNAGFRYRVENPKVSTLELGNDMTYGLGLDYAAVPDFLHLVGEVFGALPMEDVSEENSVKPLEFLVGPRLSASRCVHISAAAGTGIISDFGAPDYRVLGGLSFHCNERDTDGDGIMDHVDQCPEKAEDKDGFDDANGCPDPDNDGDGILDKDDKCPDDAESRNGVADEDGCPETDTDGDGIFDVVDECPKEAEDKDGFEDTNGCPDVDNDKDGVLDTADKCINDAEDMDGFEDEDGCPDPDNDKDGVLDINDKCPTEAEVMNGVDDEDGCPDEGKIVLVNNKIEILESVYFGINKAKIKKRSFELLDQVSAVLVGHPEIKKVRVEGHTDTSGRASKNLILSDKRAKAVREYLISKGVAADRLVAEGFGLTNPIAKPGTKGAAAKNRRVVFVILDPK